MKRSGLAFLAAVAVSCWPVWAAEPASGGLSQADEALNRALEGADLAAAERALRDGANPNANLYVGTVLSKAVLSNNPALVTLVLKAGADPNLCLPAMWCPLTRALHAERYGSVRSNEDPNRDTIAALLLRAGADPNGSPNDSASPLQHAVKHGRERIAILLLEAGASPQGRPPKDAPLATALRRGDRAVAKRLVAAGATLNPDPVLIEDIAGKADTESLDMAIGLMRKSAKGNEPSLAPALAEATEKDCAECVRRLLMAGAHYTLQERYSDRFDRSWFVLIGGADATVLAVYAAHGLDLRAADADGSTLLHLAARSGKANSVRWLVSRGVPVDARQNTSLRTPLMVAADLGHADAVRALLDAGADAALLDTWGSTPKVLAARNGARTEAHDEVVRLLHTRGALEYTGATLPASKFDAEVAGKTQDDLTGGFYTQLPFLKPGLRFFGAYTPLPMPRVVPDMRPAPEGTLYAVLPDRNVVKLARRDDIRALGLQLRSTDDALRLVRVYAEPGLAHRWRLRAQFEGTGYWELPEDGDCLALTGWNGPRKPVVVRKATADGVHYVVTRYMVPAAKVESFGPLQRLALDEIVRTTEQVRPDGAYSLKTQVLKTPGMVLEHRCGLR